MEGILEHLKKIFGVCEVGVGLIAIYVGGTCATAGVIMEAPSFGTSTLAVVGGGDLALLGCGLVVDGFRRFV